VEEMVDEMRALSEQDYATRLQTLSLDAFFAIITHLNLFILLNEDINGNIMAYDNADKGVTFEKLAEERVAKAVYGWMFPGDNGEITWRLPESSGDEMSHCAPAGPKPHPEAQWKSYHSFAKTTFGDDFKEDHSYIFTRTHYPQFAEYYRIVLAELNGGKNLFPSFCKLRQVLRESGVQHKFVFQTFGSDGPDVCEELIRLGELPADSDAVHISINKIDRNMMKVKGRFLNPDPKCVTVLQADHKHWNAHGKVHTAGKMVPNFPERPDVVSLGFDDNTCMYACNAKTGEHLPELDACIFHTTTIFAIRDEDYFINALLELFRRPGVLPIRV
jgi:hypothetical protein